MENLKEKIELVWENRELLKEKEIQFAIESVIENLDKGTIRVAQARGR